MGAAHGVGGHFVLLLVSFRSIVVPTVAIGLNLLSTAAAFGLVVAVFQWGWGNNLLGFPQVDGIAPWIPLFLFAVLFGLSMDYHVFLLSRIKERHDAGYGTREAVAFGLSRTGSLITGAALIMVAVFAGFALGDLAEFAQMGFGLAAAVIIDATVVRSILVPAVMTLLGERNWYLPRWLQWLPRVSIEGAPAAASAARVEREPEPALLP
ncbi:MMPL family transporter [Demequina litorisediminis]